MTSVLILVLPFLPRGPTPEAQHQNNIMADAGKRKGAPETDGGGSFRKKKVSKSPPCCAIQDGLIDRYMMPRRTFCNDTRVTIVLTALLERQ